MTISEPATLVTDYLLGGTVHGFQRAMPREATSLLWLVTLESLVVATTTTCITSCRLWRCGSCTSLQDGRRADLQVGGNRPLFRLPLFNRRRPRRDEVPVWHNALRLA
jgi:hypothetical protein